MSVDYRLEGDVAVITMNRPGRLNAIEATLSRAMIAHLEKAGDEAGAVVLTGAGKAFCAGADLVEMASDYEREGPDVARLLEEVFHPLVHAFAHCRVPTVAAVNGAAAGAGLGLALGCDIRIMAENAYLTSAFTAIGLVPDSGTTWWLPHHLGVSKALELALTNRRVGAEEARSLGLCMEVVPEAEVVSRATELAGSLAGLVSDSLVTTRRLIREAAASTLDQALTAEQAEQGRLAKTPEHRNRVAAFLKKRN